MKSLFTRFFDDAAIFPPGNLPLADAIPAHRSHRSAWYADLVGSFVLPDTRLAELGTEQINISLIASVEPVAADTRVVAVETRSSSLAETVGAVPVYVELAWPDLPSAVATLPTRARVKLRTGGTEVSAFPSEAELAAAIVACVEQGRQFKCTAGLHHAVRCTDPITGFEHHGFLNVLAATAAPSDATAILEERDPDVIVKELRALAPAAQANLRHSFVSLGTCSIADPVADLVALGLVSTP